MTGEPNLAFGTLRVRVGNAPGRAGAAQTVYALAVDRLAVSEYGLLYLLSVVGPQATVKSLRATLHGKIPAAYQLENVLVTHGHGTRGKPESFRKADDKQKFLVHTHHLGFGQVHALFLAQAPGFLRVISDESLFVALKSTEYTTPLLRSWVPAIRKGLVARALIDHLFCFRCDCAVLKATDLDLDAIVTSGVQAGTMQFRELSVVGDS